MKATSIIATIERRALFLFFFSQFLIYFYFGKGSIFLKEGQTKNYTLKKEKKFRDCLYTTRNFCGESCQGMVLKCLTGNA